METRSIQYYLEKNTLSALTKEEWRVLHTLLQLPENQQVLSDYLDNQLSETVNEKLAYPQVTEEVLAAVLQSIHQKEPIKVQEILGDQTSIGANTDKSTARIHFLRRWWAAAAVIIVITSAVFIYQKNNNQFAHDNHTLAQAGIIEPGKAGAILTLSDGTEVVLDSLGNRVISTQNGATAMLNNGQLVYNSAGKSAGAMEYNSITTRNGQQFSLTLSDGTKVWLNAASSIRYPTTFTGSDRFVVVTGEAYFEIAPNKTQPFKLNVGNKVIVEVLGTSFNVNAYQNETAIKTTLLEGAVRVAYPQMLHTSEVILKPGQQAQIEVVEETFQTIKVSETIDTEHVMAWKNGFFNFSGLPLEEVMRQLERWYDIKVIYDKEVPNITFKGEMTRDVTLQDVLAGMEKMGVNFKLEGRKLIVLQ